MNDALSTVVLTALWQSLVISWVLALPLLLVQKIFRLRQAARILQYCWLLVFVCMVWPHEWRLPSRGLVGWEWVYALPSAGFGVVADGYHSSAYDIQTSLMQQWLVAAWLLGGILLAVGYGWCYWQWRRSLLKRVVVASPHLTRKLTRLCRLYRIPITPDIFVAPSIATPMVLGLLRPTIVLPPNLCTDNSEMASSLAISHELMHLRSADLWVQWFILAVNIMFWFNPIAWLGRKQWESWSEFACDQAILYRLPARRHHYRRLLMGQLAQVNGLKPAWQPSVGFALSTDLERCRQLQEPPQNKTATTGLAVLLLCVITVFGVLKPPVQIQHWLASRSIAEMPGSLAKQYWLLSQMTQKVQTQHDPLKESMCLKPGGSNCF